jgi:hypothetical protein
VLNGKDILVLGWPAGKVIGLGLQTARDLESAASPGRMCSQNWKTSGEILAARWSAGPRVPWPSSPASG